MAGVLLVGIYVAIEPGEVSGALRSRGARYGGNALLVVFVFIGILGAGELPEPAGTPSVGTSPPTALQPSEQTQKVLDNLPAPVHVIAFMTPGDRTPRTSNPS